MVPWQSVKNVCLHPGTDLVPSYEASSVTAGKGERRRRPGRTSRALVAECPVRVGLPRDIQVFAAGSELKRQEEAFEALRSVLLLQAAAGVPGVTPAPGTLPSAIPLEKSKVAVMSTDSSKGSTSAEGAGLDTLLSRPGCSIPSLPFVLFVKSRLKSTVHVVEYPEGTVKGKEEDRSEEHHLEGRYANPWKDLTDPSQLVNIYRTPLVAS
ncbi:hypothetical protein NDU88_005244 [Pleurodeles waltl]|uniref:Uncharacterized protein n=1 Tax=Pleurodeles waltl TaxID=8319 RepID=A0AAV7TU90_PLEWA|nr:hypothetical protein NDU88_005244 [Pleurodeles waltl]